MYKYSRSFEVHRSTLRQDMSLNLTSRPELMIHPTPRLLRIFTKSTRPILAHHVPRRNLRELQVDNALLVHGGLDGITLSILADIHRAIFRLESMVVGGEVEVGEVLRTPVVWFAGVGGKDLRAELRRLMYAPSQLQSC